MPLRRSGAAAALLAALTAVACGSSGPQKGVAPVPPTTADTSTSNTTTTPAAGSTLAADWPTYYHDPGRSAVDSASPPAGNITPGWTSAKLDGKVYAQPLVIGSTVIVATEDDSIYALDAATGNVRWTRHLATPVDGSALPCGNIDPSGITGTPVADVATGQLWVVTFSSPATHTLWSLNLGTGAVTSSRNADPPGADPRAEQERGALALNGSQVYVPYGGLFGDCSDYHGWVVGMSTSNPASTVKATWVTPVARAGIWAPPGPVVTPDKSVLVATGNGTPIGTAGDSDSVIRLSAALVVQSSFTPANFVELSGDDKDLDSTSPALVEGMVFQIGKQGVGYLIGATNLGGLGAELASAKLCSGASGGVAVHGDLVFIACYDGLYAVRVSPAPAGGRPRLSVAWSAKGSRSGPPIVAGGLVWAVAVNGALVGRVEATGVEKYRHSISVAGSYPSPAAARGHLFAPDGDRVASFNGV